jgi:hypothetical protein
MLDIGAVGRTVTAGATHRARGTTRMRDAIVWWPTPQYSLHATRYSPGSSSVVNWLT